MQRNKVNSSIFISIGYDPYKKLLQLEFQNGSIRNYSDVPETVYEEFMLAPSLGKFYLGEIKGKYVWIITND